MKGILRLVAFGPASSNLATPFQKIPRDSNLVHGEGFSYFLLRSVERHRWMPFIPEPSLLKPWRWLRFLLEKVKAYPFIPGPIF
jgi:hypothetical protein